jgi:hypothetical protein
MSSTLPLLSNKQSANLGLLALTLIVAACSSSETGPDNPTSPTAGSSQHLAGSSGSSASAGASSSAGYGGNNQQSGTGGSQSPAGQSGQAGTGGQAGQVNTGGQSGQAGTGGTGGVSGNGGTGGVSGNGGTGGAGGNGGSSSNQAIMDPVVVEHDKNLDGFQTDSFKWRDAQGQPRTAWLVHNNAQDPTGKFGGYLRRLQYQVGGQTRTCTGSSNAHPGFGYSVNHFGNTATLSYNYKGTFQRVFEGRHHAIFRYKVQQPIDGHQVAVTIQWFFHTGHDHPLWSITYDASSAPANAISADIRSPYGDLGWDGDAGADVSGVSWGDHYRFETLSSPLTMNSAWTYNQPNQIPYVQSWTNTPDAEMGSVQTQTYQQHDAGGYWFYTSWGKSSQGPMPEDWNWTYQLNQYEIPFLLSSKRLAWGTNYGALGQSSYPAYGDQVMLKGYPYQSYSVHVVLGQHSKQSVFNQVTETEHCQATSFTASQGSVKTKGPAGISRTDTITYEPAGYNPIYASWDAQATNNTFHGTLANAQGAINHPTLRIENYTGAQAPSQILVNNQVFEQDRDYFASIDSAEHVLWLSLKGNFSTSVSIQVN